MYRNQKVFAAFWFSFHRGWKCKNKTLILVTLKLILSKTKGSWVSPRYRFHSKAERVIISQVVCCRRPLNDELIVRGSVFGGVGGPTHDDVLDSVVEAQQLGFVFLLQPLFHLAESNSRWIGSLCFHSDLHLFVDLGSDALSVCRCWRH